MITLIYGPKGSRKTIRIIDSANQSVGGTGGNILYITDQAKHSVQINNAIRFVDATDYRVTGSAQTLGFVKGLLACDNDITDVFIDGLARIAAAELNDLAGLYSNLELISEKDNINFTITVSTDKLPDFLKKYS